MTRQPLSTPLSQLLIAFTIEFDNELDHRLAEAGVGRRLPISMVMWSNFLRLVGDGITVGELVETAGIPKSKTLSTCGGMERWRYVFVSPDATGRQPATQREGWGSARALRREWSVRPTPVVGRKTQEIAPPLFGEIERHWERRFGADAVDELRKALGAATRTLDGELPEYLPIVGSASGFRAEIEHRAGTPAAPHLAALLAQALLAYTLEFESMSALSLPLSANFARILGDESLDVRDLPAITGVSKEATAMAVTFLAKNGYLSLDRKVVRLTARGQEADVAAPARHADAEAQLGPGELRRALLRVLDQGTLAEGLHPYPDGWRARRKYVAQTNAVIADPRGRLPHYPMVLHRGGWPDGS